MLSRFASLARTLVIMSSLTGAVAACDSDPAADGPLAVSIESTIYASASGEVVPVVHGATSAQLLIDGESAAESEGAPFNLPFSTDTLGEGEHELAVVVRDDAGIEERATAKLIVDRKAPVLTVVDGGTDRAESTVVKFSAEDDSPLRWIRLTVRDNVKDSEDVFLCSQVPMVIYQGCEDLYVHLIVQDAAANRSVSTVVKKGVEGGTCVTSVPEDCVPY